jgi:hypothetical protein
MTLLLWMYNVIVDVNVAIKNVLYGYRYNIDYTMIKKKSLYTM